MSSAVASAALASGEFSVAACDPLSGDPLDGELLSVRVLLLGPRGFTALRLAEYEAFALSESGFTSSQGDSVVPAGAELVLALRELLGDRPADLAALLPASPASGWRRAGLGCLEASSKKARSTGVART